MGLELSKRYSSYCFDLMSAKLYEDIGYHSGIQAVTFLGNQPSFKNFVALWNFNMEVNWKILKCAISWKRLIVEWNGRKFGTHGTTVPIGRVLLVPDSLSLVWGHSVHFAKFPILQFLKLCSSPNFHPIHPNFIQCIIIIQGVTFLGDLPKIAKIIAFWNIP